MHDDRNAVKALVALDVAGQYVAVHFRHLGIDEDQLKRVVQGFTVLPRPAGEGLELVPGFTPVGGLVVFDAHLVEDLGDFLAGHQRVVDKKGKALGGHGGPGNVGHARFAHHAGEDLFDIEDRDELAVFQFGDGGDHGLAAGHHGIGRPHFFPVDADDAVDRIHQEGLGALVELGDDHRVVLAAGGAGGADELAQRNDGDDVAAQGDHALHAEGHVGGFGDFRSLGDFADLENVDAECLAGTEREQQDFHLVGAGQFGTGIDTGKQGNVLRNHGDLAATGVSGL